VYAHRIPSGKYRGKAALVIYGLKAYREHSELIARELMRLKQYEQGLREGAVIEQVIRQAESSTESREPVIHTDANSAETVFTPLLSDLLELRRHRLREAWELPAEKVEIEPVIRRLAEKGIRDSDPLIGTDLHSSSFIYRRETHGIQQNVKMTLIPSIADLNRDARKAAEAVLIEEIRAETASGKGGPVVLLNEAIEKDGRLEAGPLLRDEAGNVLGAGVIMGQSVEKVFRAIDKLPVLERARLGESRFAATPVTLDVGGSVEEGISHNRVPTDVVRSHA
jgi:hypothetical protein